MAIPAPEMPASSSPRRRSTRKSTSPRVRTAPPPPLPNVFSWSASNRARFVELVALQSLVSRMPADSIDHATRLKDWENHADQAAGWRLLSGKTEREVADNIAFLAAADPGPEYVAAACVEEKKGGGIVFRLAMNEGVLNEGVPRRVVDGLRGICAELEAAAANERDEHKARQLVFEKVLVLHLRKIVVDLRQKFNRPIRPLSELFEGALKRNPHDSRVPSELSLISGVTSQTQSAFGDAGGVLEKLYDLCYSVAHHDSNDNREDVERLLEGCYLARRSRSFRAFMTGIRDRKELIRLIDKLGRYKAASHGLVHVAKRYPEAFKATEIQTVDPPLRESFAFPENPDTGLAKLASELTGTQVDEAVQQLKTMTGLSASKLLTKYEELYLGRPSIHAEVQLVKFYEENPSINPPKFIGTSKKACSLCNLFLELHGRFAISSAHPNLYPRRWTVSSISCGSEADVRRLQDLMEHMSTLLEESCASALSQKDGIPQIDHGRSRPSSRAAKRSASVAPVAGRTPVLASRPFAAGNAPLPNRVQQNPSSIVGPTDEAPASAPAATPVLEKGPASRGTKLAIPKMPSRRSMKKVQDWTSSRSQSPFPENVPLPPSVRSSRASTPVAAPRLQPPFSSPKDRISGIPVRRTSPRENDAIYVDAAVQASLLSLVSPVSVDSQSRHGLSEKPAYTSTGTMTTNESPSRPLTTEGTAISAGAGSMNVQISGDRHSSPSTATPQESSVLSSIPITPKSSRSTARSSGPTTPISTKSSGTVFTSTTMMSASKPFALSAAAFERRRLEKGKFAAESTASLTPRPRSPLGALNLTIERHSPPSSPVKGKSGRPAETVYTIYLAGNYSDSLPLGEAVFSGKLSEVGKRGEIMQCKGFRLRSGLRKRKVDGTEKGGKAEKPLRVHEVLKSVEVMVLDIIFPDAVVRMEVFWDEEARSEVTSARA